MKNSRLQFANAGEIKVGGYAGKMIDFVVKDQLLDEPTWALLVDQFRRREDSINGGWRGEYWGKMMRGASLTYRVTKNEKLYSVLSHTVRDMLTTQDELGRFSSYRADKEFFSWDMWGRKYVMLGMMYFLEICKSKELKRRIVTALKKHADYIIKHVGEGRIHILDTSHVIGTMNSASVLEPFVKLYALTDEQKYLDFATYIINTGMCKGADLVDLVLNTELYPYQFPQTKAYEMMSCFEGLLEYYKHTGNPDHLLAVERFVDRIIKTDYTLIGSSGCNHEFLDNSTLTQTEPAKQDVMQETCVTVTLMKLCAKLLSFTGKSKYAEYIERSGLNAMLGAVNNEKQQMRRALVRTWLEGGEVYYVKDHEAYPFDSYSPLYMDRRGMRCGGVQLIGEGRTYGCCVCIGSAGTAILGLFGIMKADNGLYVNLYNDCKFKSVMRGESVTLEMRANPYKADGARIKVCGRGEKFALALRVPTWAEGFAVSVNSEAYEGVERDGYLFIERVWQDSDTVEISFRAPVKMRVINGKIAFTRGAIALARDKRLDDIESPLNVIAKDGKTVRAKRVKNTVFNANLTLQLKTRDGKITLCDYAQTGKNYDDDNTGMTVWQNV
jgi:DUF1680 family protein